MDGLWVFYEQLVILCNFNILWWDSLPRPPLFQEMGKLPQILPQNFTVPHSLTCCNQTVQHMKMGKYSFKRGIITLRFMENMQASLCPFWGTVADSWHNMVACSCSFNHSPDGATIKQQHSKRVRHAKWTCVCCGVSCNSSSSVF